MVNRKMFIISHTTSFNFGRVPRQITIIIIIMFMFISNFLVSVQLILFTCLRLRLLLSFSNMIFSSYTNHDKFVAIRLFFSTKRTVFLTIMKMLFCFDFPLFSLAEWDNSETMVKNVYFVWVYWINFLSIIKQWWEQKGKVKWQTI